MELLKKNIRMNRQKSKAVNQITLDEDHNVPDSKPDIGSIIQENGTIKVENTKIMENHVLLSGALEISILYISDNGEKQLHRMNTRLPFEEKLNLDGVDAGDNISLKWTVEDLNVHMINSRKVSIQALMVFMASIEEIYDAQAGIEVKDVDELSTMTKTLEPLSLAVQKKDIVRVKDEIALASNKPNIGELLWDNVQLRGTDIRVMDGELDVKGELFAFALYAGDDENSTKQWVEMALPFHETITCGSSAAFMIPDVEMTLSACTLEVRPDYDGEERLIQVEAVLDLDIKLYEEDKVEILADVYSPLTELKPVMKQEIYESLIVKNFSKCRSGELINMEENQPRMLQICHSKGDIKIDDTTIVNNGIQVEGSVFVTILYITSDDTLPFAVMNSMVPFQHTIEVEGINTDCRFSLKTELEQLSTTMIDSEKIEAKVSINLNALVVQVHHENCISDVVEEELDLKKLQDLPGIVGYIVQPGDSLWSIAKSYCTTPYHIKELNELETDEIQTGNRLIIMKETPKIR